MKKARKTIMIYVVVGIAALVCIFVIIGSVFYAPVDGESMSASIWSHLFPPSTTKSSRASLNPMSLSIPSVGIKANVQQVGITKKGNIGTPNNFTDAAWYKNSPMPGAKGTSIIDGHVDNGLALHAVFWNLKNVKKGDSVYVTTKKGGTVHFVVTDISTYDFDAPTADILAPSNNATLKLITCAGVYIAALKTHDKRLVVTAEKVTS